MELFDFELVRVVEEDQEANLPKEIADYLNKMGARIPNVKPGKATIEYLSKVHTILGGLLLSVLATISSVLDHYLWRTNAGFAIGFTSVLIIVSARKVL
ncbi:preprotein translocase subunit SCY2, chloroplastic [Trifolium repens]|nr:preprotein translocase subunit SCY2, chloroplastic [Trifolium repens]